MTSSRYKSLSGAKAYLYVTIFKPSFCYFYACYFIAAYVKKKPQMHHIRMTF